MARVAKRNRALDRTSESDGECSAQAFASVVALLLAETLKFALKSPIPFFPPGMTKGDWTLKAKKELRWRFTREGFCRRGGNDTERALQFGKCCGLLAQRFSGIRTAIRDCHTLSYELVSGHALP